MINPLTMVDYDNPCAECEGAKFYKASRKCVRCSYRKRLETLSCSRSPVAVRPDKGKFGVEAMGTSQFKAAERRMYAGVQYDNVKKGYL